MPRGSAPGERRGERRLRVQEGLAAARHGGKLPLAIMLAVARGGPEADRISDRQLQAAIAAAPYIHPKLAAVAVEDVTPPDPERDAKRRQVRDWLFKRLEEMAKPEPLVIEQEQPQRSTTLPRPPNDWPQ